MIQWSYGIFAAWKSYTCFRSKIDRTDSLCFPSRDHLSGFRGFSFFSNGILSCAYFGIRSLERNSHRSWKNKDRGRPRSNFQHYLSDRRSSDYHFRLSVIRRNFRLDRVGRRYDSVDPYFGVYADCRRDCFVFTFFHDSKKFREHDSNFRDPFSFSFKIIPERIQTKSSFLHKRMELFMSGAILFRTDKVV